VRSTLCVIGWATALILGLTCDSASVPHGVLTHTFKFTETKRIIITDECRRRTPTSWACVDFINAQLLR
jgi:hypothetical protein